MKTGLIVAGMGAEQRHQTGVIGLAIVELTGMHGSDDRTGAMVTLRVLTANPTHRKNDNEDNEEENDYEAKNEKSNNVPMLQDKQSEIVAYVKIRLKKYNFIYKT